MKKKILLIEDEKDISDLIKAFLERNNFEVTVAYDGEEALVKAKERPDLIILDLMLPKIDGVEVLRRLKSNPETKFIPAIILTGRSESSTIFETTEMGAYDYIIKPVEMK